MVQDFVRIPKLQQRYQVKEGFNKYQKRVFLEHLHNMRDLGGYPTTVGHVTKWDLLYRSDLPAFLTEEEWKRLKDLNITLMIDLRSDRERKNTPVTPGYLVEYYAVPLMKEMDEAIEAVDQASTKDQTDQAIREFMKSMGLDYTKTLFGNLQGAVQVLDLILGNLGDGGSTLFFCSAGKNRTGIIAVLVLYLCNVPREDIIADYMVSCNYNNKGINQILNHIPAELESILPNQEAFQKYIDSAPGTMADLLDSFENRDIRKALAKNVFDPEKQ